MNTSDVNKTVNKLNLCDEAMLLVNEIKETTEIMESNPDTVTEAIRLKELTYNILSQKNPTESDTTHKDYYDSDTYPDGYTDYSDQYPDGYSSDKEIG